MTKGAFAKTIQKEREFIEKFKNEDFPFEDKELIGNNSKAGQHICTPVIECKPTAACIENCYTLWGPISWSASVSKQVRSYLHIMKRVAAGKTKEVAANLDKHTKKPFLRWFGKGDAFDAAVDVINEQTIPLHIFSKKPEMLKRMKVKNPASAVLQSWDYTNIDKREAVAGVKRAFTVRPQDMDQKMRMTLEDFDVIFIDHSPSKKKQFDEVFNALTKGEKKKVCPGVFPGKHEGACEKCFKAKVGCFNG